MSVLDTVEYPKDLKNLNIKELQELSSEIRQLIINTVARTGGHLASALGTVDLIVAMHYIFDAPKDKIIFDVGHQSYAHKIITGRKNYFHTLRQFKGENSFTRASDSEYDTFISGHSSTSLSVATGIMRARKLSGDNYEIISLIGDGALTGGMTHEALNDAGSIEGKQIIILNDNSMSISKSVGSVANYFGRLHTKRWYNGLKNSTLKILNKPKKPKMRTITFLRNFKNSFKYFLQGAIPFDQYGIKYFGPIDGHNMQQIIDFLKIAKNESKSVILHVVTKKGYGFQPAEENPNRYHGVAPYGEICPDNTFSNQAGETLIELAKVDKNIVAVTAAMGSGTGLERFEHEYPDRFFDVGIAEAHAVTMCSALSTKGYKPYFLVYSTFLQRGFDQIIHDVAIEENNVTFLIDRSGIVGPDGETHQGVFDISYLNLIPNIAIASPMDIRELDLLLRWSQNYNKPLAIRYPRGCVYNNCLVEDIKYGKWSKLIDKGNKVVIIATGADMVNIALQVANERDVDIINARFIKPLDNEMLDSIINKKVIVLEDNVINGGLFSSIASYYMIKKQNIDLTPISILDRFIPQGSKAELFEMIGLDSKSIISVIDKLSDNN